MARFPRFTTAAFMLVSSSAWGQFPDKPSDPPAAAAAAQSNAQTTESVEPQDTETPEQKAARRAQAVEHFEKAKTLYKNQDYGAALAEFLEARRIFPTWSATSWAAGCLKLLHRYDESLDMFEILLRDYDKKMPQDARVAAQQALVEMRGLVGVIDIEDAEFDAGIRIDGRNRGTYPSPAPYRVAAGSHIVRVYKEGFEPFETNVDVAGNQVQTVKVRLRKLDLDQAGRLRVSEANNRELDVIIDGSVVGKTPWEGALRDGEHNVVLDGEGAWGTQPAIVRVTKGRTETLGLSAEQLEANIKIMPTPAGATVAIDGVSLGRGVWQGKVRTGSHRVEIAADGYVLHVHVVDFAKGTNEPIRVQLDRDPLSPLWKDNRGRVFVEASLGPGIVPTFGGDVVKNCLQGCSQGVGAGVSAKAHGGYRFPSGFFLGIDVGYMYAWQKVADRDTSLQPPGFQPQAGTVSDTLSLGGVLVGASAGIRIGKKWPLSLRLGAGAFFGARFRDHRVGTFQTVAQTVGTEMFSAETYSVDMTQYASTTALYVEPNVQMAFPLAERLHLQAGIDALILVSPQSVPTWSNADPTSRVRAGSTGQAVFPEQPLMGSVLVFVAPEVSLRYEF